MRKRPKLTTFFGLIGCSLSGKDIQISDNMSDLKSKISTLVRSDGSNRVWVPADFSTLGSRDAIDKTLQRMVSGGELRRIDRGLYDRPAVDQLTKLPVSPDYRAVVDAIARRDQLRLLVDGSTAANDLGLCDARPTRVTIHTDARRRAIKLDNLVIEFKQTAPSRLYWAGRPAMRVVQALHWLKDTPPPDRLRILGKLTKVLEDPQEGNAIRQDLVGGFALLPAWMQGVVRELPGCDPMIAAASVFKVPRTGTSTGIAARKVPTGRSLER